jgi:branched-chain amino acid transport system substrate-binding protein
LFLPLALSGCYVQTVPGALPPPQAMVASPPLIQPPPPPTAAPSEPGEAGTKPRDRLVDLGGKINVALLLPLSAPGRVGILGRDMLDASQLALQELADDGIALTPRDTKGTPDGAAAAARRAVSEGAALIIGPLTAAEIEAVRPVAQPAGINVLAFSNVSQVAGHGVFLLGVLPQDEVLRIVRYAHSTGIDHFALLAPANAYGQLAGDAMKTEVATLGATLDATGFYDPSSADLRQVERRLATAPGFSALLLPDPDAARLKNAASLLPGFGIDPTKVRLLGTGGSGEGWEADNLGTEATLNGGWFAAPPAEARAAFEQHFLAAYGRKPQRLATLAYDAVGVATVLERTPGGGFSAAALTNPSGFAGADGIFRLLPDGTAQRGLAVFQVERSGISVVSPAPETFEQTAQ